MRKEQETINNRTDQEKKRIITKGKGGRGEGEREREREREREETEIILQTKERGTT